MPLNTPLPDLSADAGRRAATRAFWSLACLHLILWTLVPLAVQPVAPLDMVEMRYWGHQWQLGYHKHPPLPGWIAEASAVASGGHFWGVYLASQLGMVTCLWAVWRLGREILPPWLAFIGACLMETCYWYTMGSVEYNNNVGMYPFWALTILFFYWALRAEYSAGVEPCRAGVPSVPQTDGDDAGETFARSSETCVRQTNICEIGWWVATGVMLGLGMLCKYSMAVLAITVFLFLLAHPTARRAWRRPGPYLMIGVSLLVFGPHLAWAISHRMPSLSYAGTRTLGGPRFWGHLLCPLEFTGSQLLVLLPAAIALVPLAGFRWRLRQLAASERFPRDFLLAMTLGPFLFQVTMAGLFNVRLLSAYGSQLWMFAGLTLLYCVDVRPTTRAIGHAVARCVAIGLAFVVVGAIHDVATPYVAHEPLRIHCPSPVLAAKVQEAWNARYRRRLPIIAGDWWLAANAAFYGPSVPVIYGSSEFNRVDMSPWSSEWSSDEHLTQDGGVVLWSGACQGNPVAEIRRRFPKAKFLPPVAIPWQTGAAIPPLKVSIAVIPPKQGA